jgi:thiol:disulfide interchange protein
MVYIWWGLQIHSLSRLFSTALWLVPLIAPAAFWAYRKMLPNLRIQAPRALLAVALFALLLALLSAAGLSTHLFQRHILRLEISPPRHSLPSISLKSTPMAARF